MDEHKSGTHHHHILPVKHALGIGGALLVLTAITVWIAGVDLGPFNFLVAMAVATVKGSLVALIFMNLKYDKRENGVIFATSFLFLAIFIVLTVSDLFYRGDVYVKKGDGFAVAQVKSKVKRAWVATPDLVSKGKELYALQCVSCHGANGQGDGPAAAALNPRPRNFHATEGWKNGRKPSQVFKTLKEGIPGSAMASYGTLPSDDRWAIAHYVLSLGPTPPADSAADLAAIGIDPSKDDGGGGGAEEKSVPVEVAMKAMAVAPVKAVPARPRAGGESSGERIYEARCASCHGEAGQGGVKVKSLGAQAWVVTEPLSAEGDFDRIVMRGLPGDLMPGSPDLSGAELRELQSFVRGLAAR